MGNGMGALFCVDFHRTNAGVIGVIVPKSDPDMGSRLSCDAFPLSGIDGLETHHHSTRFSHLYFAKNFISMPHLIAHS